MIDPKELKSLEHLRDRLLDMVRGDEFVDIGTLTYELNRTIEKLGGEKVKLTRDELMPRFFTEKE